MWSSILRVAKWVIGFIGQFSLRVQYEARGCVCPHTHTHLTAGSDRLSDDVKCSWSVHLTDTHPDKHRQT
jgi:hypothetical protein